MDDTSDVVTVDRYGRANPGVFGGVWFDHDRLQVGITAELELHEARLRPLLTLPDRVDVVPARWTVEHLNGVRAEAERVVAAHPGLARSSGMGIQRICFDLRADGEAVAADLHAQFDGALELTVGGHPYPRGYWGIAPEPPTPTWPSEGVELWLRLDSDEVRSGDDLTGTLVVHNATTAPVLLTGRPTQIATVLDEHGTLAGTFDGFLTDEGMHRVVDPDRIIYLPVLGGTAGTDTYATPPGRYRVVASLDVAEDDGIRSGGLSAPPRPCASPSNARSPPDCPARTEMPMTEHLDEC